MTFNVAADAYDAFMGRYSRLLVGQMADLAEVRAGDRALDVGCGPGALTTELVARLGADHVAAVDPSASFVAAVRERLPGVDVRQGGAEALPFDDGAFDAAIAQLVVHFMSDPVGGIGEMRRVTRPGGVVAACVWDHAGGRGPVSAFWAAAATLDPRAANESQLPGAHAGHLTELFIAAGLHDVVETTVSAPLTHESFEAWWAPYEAGVGPAGAHVKSLSPEGRVELRERCREMLPAAPFTDNALAWAATGRVASIP
jgi:SAM-dependent methyltransferase